MRRILILVLMLCLTASMAFSMARVVTIDEPTKPATSFIVGCHWDYNTLPGASAKGRVYGMMGFATPIAADASGGRVYGLAFGEMGNIDGGSQKQVETRLIVYPITPGTGLNVGFLCGAGVTWNEYDPASELLPGETIAYLMGTTGIVLSKPLSKSIGGWVAGEFQLGEDISQYRLGAGLNIYFGF